MEYSHPILDLTRALWRWWDWWEWWIGRCDMKMHQNNALQPIDRHQWCLIRDHPPLPTICPYCSIAITMITMITMIIMITMINHHDHGKFKDGDVFFGHLSAPVINCVLFFYKSYSNQPAWYQYFGKTTAFFIFVTKGTFRQICDLWS